MKVNPLDLIDFDENPLDLIKSDDVIGGDYNHNQDDDDALVVRWWINVDDGKALKVLHLPSWFGKDDGPKWWWFEGDELQVLLRPLDWVHRSSLI